MKRRWYRWIALGLTVGLMGVQAPAVHAEDMLGGNIESGENLG